MFNFLLYGVSAAAIFVTLQAIVTAAGSLGYVQRRIDRRLNEISASDTTTEFLRRRLLGENVPPWLGTLLNSSLVRWFDQVVMATGLAIATEKLLLYMTLAVPAVVLVLHLFHLRLAICIPAALIAAYAVPMWLLTVLKDRRLNKLMEQLPDATDMLVRSLRAGHPVPTGVRTIALEMENPIRTEFRLIADAMTYGLDLRSAFLRVERRIPIQEFRYLGSAVRIQYETGGNLAEILATLSSVMRGRVRLRLKVKALSAESRLSGRILSVIPFGIMGFINELNPDYYAGVRDSPVLTVLMAVAICLVLIGILIIRRMVQIRV